jgi:hypothetical protein
LAVFRPGYVERAPKNVKIGNTIKGGKKLTSSASAFVNVERFDGGIGAKKDNIAAAVPRRFTNRVALPHKEVNVLSWHPVRKFIATKEEEPICLGITWSESESIRF